MKSAFEGTLAVLLSALVFLMLAFLMGLYFKLLVHFFMSGWRAVY